MLPILFAVAVAAGAAPGGEKAVVVKREGVFLRQAPASFAGVCPGAIAPGTELVLVEQSARVPAWWRVASPGGGKCWINEVAWLDRKSGELSGRTAETSSKDVELADRGFTEEEQRQYQKDHPEMKAGFAAVQAYVERAPEPEPADVRRFAADGKLGGQP